MATIIIAYFETAWCARAASCIRRINPRTALPEIAFRVEASVRRQASAAPVQKADRGSTIEGLSRLADHDGLRMNHAMRALAH